MSTAILSADCMSIYNFPNIGFGSDFEILKKFYGKIISDLRKTETLRRLDEVLLSLDEVFEECYEEGWDGYEARPITEDAYNEAKRLIESLPLTSIPMPEIIPEPSGEIALEWSRGKRQVFVASVSGKNEIVYAGLFGMNKTHGTEYFSDLLPLEIIKNIRRLYED